MLGDIPPDRPRPWFDLLEQRWPKAEEAVQDQLVAAGAVTVELGRTLGVIRTRKVSVTDPGAVRALRDRVREVARSGPGPVEEAVLAVLAIDGNVSTVFGWRDLCGHKPAVRALKDRVDHELPGLRSALIQSIALRRAS